MSAATLTEFLASQDELVQEAALALPHSFSECTYTRGYIRQAICLCLTCPEPRGVCSACSIACHTNHEQVELFPKRNFRCDCPTTAMAHQCTLHARVEDENALNKYGQNFLGKFCRCGRPYDAMKEREAMIQCLSCEDWFHESCCNLRERPPSREVTPVDHPQIAADITEAADETASEASSSGLPLPLITASDYDSFVCAACVSEIPILKRLAGTPGTIMVIRDNPSEPWRRLEDNSHAGNSMLLVDGDSSTSGNKRPRSPSVTDDPRPKKARASPSPAPISPCLAPPPNPVAQQIFSSLISNNTVLGTGDLFLTEGFRERWCRCSSCMPSLKEHPYLLEEEETYEPPDDPDSGLSFEELGMRALERIPRDRAIEGIHAFNEMRANLVRFLRPFAQEGKTVNEVDVRSFFDSLMESARKNPA